MDLAVPVLLQFHVGEIARFLSSGSGILRSVGWPPSPLQLTLAWLGVIDTVGVMIVTVHADCISLGHFARLSLQWWW